MYNISEDCGRQIKTRLTSLVDWHKTRSGFLHHILSQKMGLFHHTGASDISSSTQAAVKQCNTVQRTTSLVINTAPVSEVHMSVCHSVSICQHVYVCNCIFVFVSVYLSVSLAVSLSVCLSLCICVSIYQHVCM